MWQAWEKCASLRGRFRKGLPWLQWPIPGSPKPGVDGKTKRAKDPRTPNTRAVELNVDVLSKMLEWNSGEFVDIAFLEREAPSFEPCILHILDRPIAPHLHHIYP